MKTISLTYNCMPGNSNTHFQVSHLHVADYPLTFTPQECLEEFCESVGWRILSCESAIHLILTYSFEIEQPVYQDANLVILNAYSSFRMRRALGSC